VWRRWSRWRISRRARCCRPLLNVDIDDAGSVEAFQDRRRRDSDLHRMMEKALSETVWGAAKVALTAIAIVTSRPSSAYCQKQGSPAKNAWVAYKPILLFF
jgi:hypothetical protein